MRILITGGAGYLGGYLGKRLIRNGDSVKVIDINKTKYIPENSEFHQVDIRDHEAILSITQDIDIVYHLAFVQTPSFLPERIQEEVNILGTKNIIDSSIKNNVKKFIFISTIDVYGSKPLVPITENNRLDPVNLYAKHKIVCENLCEQAFRFSKLNYAIGRLPLICGQGFYNHKPFLSIFDRIIENKVVYLPKPGSTVADMIHINDAIEGLTLLQKYEANEQIFHFSASEPATQLQIAHAAIRSVNSSSRIRLLPKVIVRWWAILTFLLVNINFPMAEVDYLFYDFYCDNSKAKKRLGYLPKYSVVDAASELIKGYSTDRAYIKSRSIGEGLEKNGRF